MSKVVQVKETFLRLTSLFEKDDLIQLELLRSCYQFFSNYQDQSKPQTHSLIFQKILPTVNNMIFDLTEKVQYIPTRKFTLEWTSHGGVRGSFHSLDSSNGKTTDVDHFYKILTKIRDYTNSYNSSSLVTIFTLKKQSLSQIQITMQKGLGFKPKNGVSYIEENLLFYNLCSKLKKKFMVQSLFALRELHKLKIEHFDVSYRNFILSLLGTKAKYKLIDFDQAIWVDFMTQSMKYSKSKAQNQKQLCQSDVTKNFQSTWVKMFTQKELLQYSENKLLFIQKYLGKVDVAMFGFMIARLLINSPKGKNASDTSINQLIRQLQNMSYPDKSLQFNSSAANQFLQKNFRPQYIKLICYVLQKMLIPSFSKRCGFDQILNTWRALVNEIPDEVPPPSTINDVQQQNISVRSGRTDDEDVELQQNMLKFLNLVKEKKISETWSENISNQQNKIKIENRNVWSKYQSDLNNKKICAQYELSLNGSLPHELIKQQGNHVNSNIIISVVDIKFSGTNIASDSDKNNEYKRPSSSNPRINKQKTNKNWYQNQTKLNFEQLHKNTKNKQSEKKPSIYNLQLKSKRKDINTSTSLQKNGKLLVDLPKIQTLTQKHKNS